MIVNYYLKSHCEMPDVESWEEVKERPDKCFIKLAADEEDTIGYLCSGKIEWHNNFGVCCDCGCQYEIENK